MVLTRSNTKALTFASIVEATSPERALEIKMASPSAVGTEPVAVSQAGTGGDAPGCPGYALKAVTYKVQPVIEIGGYYK